MAKLIYRRRDDESKNNRVNTYITVGISLLMTVIFSVVICLIGIERIPEASALSITYNYIDNNQPVLLNESIYRENAAEYLYLQGLKAYSEGDSDSAVRFFDEFLAAIEESDSALKEQEQLTFYTYYFLNMCYQQKTGKGNMKYVREGINAASGNVYIANRHELIWDMAYSVAWNKRTDNIVVNMLKKLINETENMSLTARVRYSNEIAMLNFFDGKYAKSIMGFYDVLGLTEGVRNPEPELVRQIAFANSYIAAFYYEFEVYNLAIEAYIKNLNIEFDDPYLNAQIKYPDFLNLSSSYLEMGKTAASRATCIRAKALLPYLDEDIAADVEAQIYDNMAHGAIIEGKYEEAEYYLVMAKKLLGSANADAFHGSEAFITLTECRFDMATGNDALAADKLEELLESGEAEYAGFEKEVYELLSKVYMTQKNIEKYKLNSERLNKYNEAFNTTIKKEYMDFTRYYADAEYLKDLNVALRNSNREMWIIVGLVSLILAGVAFALVIVRRATFTDQLTGVKNRRYLSKLTEKYDDKSVPANTGIVMLDIDYFKKYNDLYGHVKGDEVIKNVAKAIDASIRKKDCLIRYGGEEFLIVMENFKDRSAYSIGYRMLQSVRSLNILHEGSEAAACVTVSIGICINYDDNADFGRLISKADEALYESKKNGRNQFTIK